ncbi:MAG TPA: endonuclease III [Planctomycetota bacterium]|nr:endonuclease III [Planctomycetota bacterium]
MAVKIKKLRAPSPQKLQQAQKVDALLKAAYPDAKCSLDYSNPLQLLIATILSAQCTDARVNKTTPALWAKFKTAKDFASANPAELEKMIQSTGFFRSKTKSILEACRDIAEKHNGVVPRTLEELTALRGVGRKTANVVLGNAFDTPGMVVDTHIGRVSRRLGLTKQTDPVKVEHELMQLFPPKRWTPLGHEMILHGRKYCKAPTPRCAGCPLLEICPYPKKNFDTPTE